MGRGQPPRIRAADLRDSKGAFDAAKFDTALNETHDVVVVDQQSSLTLMQLNGLVAADSVVIPQTMKGFDLEIGAGEHIVLPTMVQEQNNQDTD